MLRLFISKGEQYHLSILVDYTDIVENASLSKF